MANEVQALVDRIVAAGGDTSAGDALARYNTAHKKMVARSKCVRATLSMGNTVAGTAFYALPLTVIEALFFSIGGVPYGKAAHPDVYGYSQGMLLWVGGGGLLVADGSAAGLRGVTVIPTPASVLAISVFAVVHAADQVGADTPLVDVDFYDDLADYAIALGRERDDERMDAGAAFRSHFDLACEEQRRRAARRFRGPGPAQIRVQGLNA